MFEDFVASTRTYLRERITSPLLATFAASWCIWNWRFLFVLFSDLPIVERLSYIDHQINYQLKQTAIDHFVGPIITTTAFLWAYPQLVKIVFSYWKQKQKEIRDIRMTIESETLLSAKESREIIGQMFEMEDKFTQEISQRDKHINELKAIIQSMQQEASSEAPVPESQNSSGQDVILSSDESAVLEAIARNDDSAGFANEADLRNVLAPKGFDPMNIRVQLGNLVEKRMLNPIGHDSGGNKYSLTHSGRKAVLNVRTKRALTEDKPEVTWRREFESLSIKDRASLSQHLKNVVQIIANPNFISSPDSLTYAIAKGLAKRDPNSGLYLTEKGEFLAALVIEF